ncbi:hypothetical protein ISN45_Aa05g005210 [Arabidopsis thaliana x Arabidopsis arenosa]|uniref:Transmembrane protein n=1 Tax=Arabidopsis thaliana x Arabidopsis arenosa TaxID=1240361 RepID=A0A8T1ZIA0_9BRAS|nr:hypothetical protein ISN45_Aa05g005210 [Arabidopsis thaliana x Arabidopsis arenosa]
MAEFVLGVIVGAAGLWKLMGTFSSENSSKAISQIEQSNSSISMGWIILIFIGLVGLVLLNMNAEKIRHKAEEQAPVFVIAGILLFLIFILHIKGVF